ncbi:Mediator of RNA polymerase II transcription subunit 26 [Liparis tanakae]|uniref:Mediator of RNA polymerase II transcription subunit 26 n=1 Tax=Liparis tanakae TaxID=230148 RepID=A0A4Z2EYG9_9TELE|nr:Mediator of RNA polymerase II transcription subunit 26 [Liparis tanakae]
MTAATAATPQGMRDRLLQAVDGQSNICNMVVVMEVISYLEKTPITKEELEETRLGKLINDVRKKTKNEDLAKRAKKLLRTWQKLIEPGKGEGLSRAHGGAAWSSHGAAHACISTLAAATAAGKTGPELKNRNDFNNCSSPRVEKPSGRKRKADQKDGALLPAKIPKTTFSDKTQNSKQPPTNGIGGGADVFTETRAHQSSEREIPEPPDNERLNKIPVNAVKPHPSAPGFVKPPSTSSLLKASVLQQQARQERAFSGGQCRPRSPRCSAHGPQAPKQECGVKPTAPPQAPGLSSPAARPGSAEPSGPEPSSQPLPGRVQGLPSGGADVGSPSGPPSTSVHKAHASPCSDGRRLEDGGPVNHAEKRKRQKSRPKDRVAAVDAQTVEDDTKPVRLKDRRLTFDAVTGQIKSSFHKESSQEGGVRPGPGPEAPCPEPPKQNPLPPPSAFQQTDWKELSRSDIIQSYLSQQSNVLTSSGAHPPGAHFFKSDFLKKEEQRSSDVKETHVLAPELPARDLPGVGREVVEEDLDRLHRRRWAGVNGCCDTKGAWYDWTECVSLDLHGDDSRLNILPYVLLD